MSFTSQTTLTQNQSDNMYLSYCCSSCSNPVVLRLTLNTTQNAKSNPFKRVNADEIDSLVAHEHASNRNDFMDYLANPTPETYPVDKVSGLDSPCPVCGNREAWQVPELLENNRSASPSLVNNSLTNCYSWCQKILRDRKPFENQAFLFENAHSLALSFDVSDAGASEKRVSLNPLPKITKYIVSDFTETEKEELTRVLTNLNASLHIARDNKEGE